MESRPVRPLFQRIFISPEEPRLRAGWRILGQLIFLVLAFILIGSLYAAATGKQFSELLNVEALLENILVIFTALTVSVYLARRLLDHRSFASLGVSISAHTLPDLLFGFLVTGVMFAGVYAVLWAAGWLHYEGIAWQTDSAGRLAWQMASLLLIFFLGGWEEEIFSRGYQLQNIEEGMNLTWGVILSSLLFSSLHLTNPGTGWASVVGILAGGLFFAYGYVRTRSLWLPIGLHLGWNFFEGPVFGFQVSGLEIYRLVRHTLSAPEIVGGGVFGPEAGLIILPFVALGAVLIYAYTRRRKEARAVQGALQSA